MMAPPLGQHPFVNLVPTSAPSQPLSPLEVLESTFESFIEATGNDVSWESSKSRISEIEGHLHSHGLSGRDSLAILSQMRSHICWESMAPEQFIKFYRFMFHTCKEPKRKHLQVNVALEAWKLVLSGRFRLLDRWCEFIQSRSDEIHVISEDQWRQVLDFSRTVHEDLSNFDPHGAWVWMLDEFVDYMRKQRTLRAQQMDCDAFADVMEPDSSTSRMSPHCGSKRRSPDIDVVAEQLSAMPLSSTYMDHLFKKHCGEAGLTSISRSSPLMASPCEFEMPQDLIQNLQPVQTVNRRTVRTRRSGVSDLVNSIVSDALGFPTL